MTTNKIASFLVVTVVGAGIPQLATAAKSKKAEAKKPVKVLKSLVKRTSEVDESIRPLLWEYFKIKDEKYSIGLEAQDIKLNRPSSSFRTYGNRKDGVYLSELATKFRSSTGKVFEFEISDLNNHNPKAELDLRLRNETRLSISAQRLTKLTGENALEFTGRFTNGIVAPDCVTVFPPFAGMPCVNPAAIVAERKARGVLHKELAIRFDRGELGFSTNLPKGWKLDTNTQMIHKSGAKPMGILEGGGFKPPVPGPGIIGAIVAPNEQIDRMDYKINDSNWTLSKALTKNARLHGGWRYQSFKNANSLMRFTNPYSAIVPLPDSVVKRPDNSRTNTKYLALESQLDKKTYFAGRWEGSYGESLVNLTEYIPGGSIVSAFNGGALPKVDHRRETSALDLKLKRDFSRTFGATLKVAERLQKDRTPNIFMPGNYGTCPAFPLPTTAPCIPGTIINEHPVLQGGFITGFFAAIPVVVNHRNQLRLSERKREIELALDFKTARGEKWTISYMSQDRDRPFREAASMNTGDWKLNWTRRTNKTYIKAGANYKTVAIGKYNAYNNYQDGLVGCGLGPGGITCETYQNPLMRRHDANGNDQLGFDVMWNRNLHKWSLAVNASTVKTSFDHAFVGLSDLKRDNLAASATHPIGKKVSWSLGGNWDVQERKMRWSTVSSGGFTPITCDGAGNLTDPTGGPPVVCLPTINGIFVGFRLPVLAKERTTYKGFNTNFALDIPSWNANADLGMSYGRINGENGTIFNSGARLSEYRLRLNRKAKREGAFSYFGEATWNRYTRTDYHYDYLQAHLGGLPPTDDSTHFQSLGVLKPSYNAQTLRLGIRMDF